MMLVVILYLNVQFISDVLSLFLSLYGKPWMNWINAILRQLDKYLGPCLVLGFVFPMWSGWPQKAVLLLFGGYIFSGTISLWIFPSQSLSIELIILDEYWFTTTKFVLGCPRKASFFIIRTDKQQRDCFSFLNNYLPTI